MKTACDKFMGDHEEALEDALVGSKGGADEISKGLCKEVLEP